ncbi:polysaccharide biosynthesis/export family protein [Parvularcula marina]|uniref:Polysaccharide export protein n=1 Tax=Parvularcula marina TaxID=2292771 RepID=A0A371RGC7_9PROT|nr:polysaccharide biosynthesis/export family protein [Parvularcula marina]RFB04491.1 polysaccharide export protein [Parvularcula marina]
MPEPTAMCLLVLRRRIAAFLLAMFGLAACSSTADDFDSQFDPATPPDVTALYDSSSQVLKSADVVRVTVFGVEDLGGEYQIDFDGKLRFPLIGQVEAEGFTPVQLAAILEVKLGEDYLQDPEVQVKRIESVGERITVDGSVTKPGIYELEGNITLLQAIALAGGPSEGANKKKVILFRQVEGQRMAAAFNLNEIREGEAIDPRVYGNDIVVVDGSGAKSRYGDLVRAAPFLGLLNLLK